MNMKQTNVQKYSMQKGKKHNMNKTPNYADVVRGTLGRVLEQHSAPIGMYSDLYDELIKTYCPKYFVQDGFTVATLVHRGSEITEFVGVSKRNASDPKLPLRGKSLALSRAIRSFALTRLQQLAMMDDKRIDNPTGIDRLKKLLAS